MFYLLLVVLATSGGVYLSIELSKDSMSENTQRPFGL